MKRQKPAVQIEAQPAYSEALEGCQPEDTVVVEIEPDNPHDMLALVAKVRGETIGYISPESWLIGAVHLQDKAIAAKIRSVERSGAAVSRIWLKVSIASQGSWDKYWRANY